MNGITAREIAEILGISYDNVRKRIEKAKIKPITKDAIYPLDTLEKIREVAPVGRPPKKTEPPVEARNNPAPEKESIEG